MKKLSTFLSMGLLALLTACGTTQSSTADTQTTNRGRSNTAIGNTSNSPASPQQASRISTSTSSSTTGQRQATTQRSTPTTVTTTTANRNTVAKEEARMQKMYSILNMNDAQITRFESECKASENSWNSTNHNKAMNNFERTESQDRILKEILDDAQFKKYQQWARDNARTDK